MGQSSQEKETSRQSGIVKLTHTQAQSSESIGRTPPISETYKPSIGEAWNTLTSSAEASPARTSASQGKAQASKKARARGSGSSSQGASVRYDLATSSWKTSQCSLSGDCTLSLPTLPKRGMMRSGIIYPLPPLELGTEGNASLSLPTPTASDNRERTLEEYEQSRTGKWVRKNRTTGGSAPNLATMVKMFPTPASRDWKGARKPETLLAAGRTPNNSLPDSVEKTGTISGKLNPAWVEWLMGFPTGWTELSASETPSCHRRRKSSGK